MSNYRYIAKDKTGKSVTGVLEMNSEVDAIEYLHKNELIIISVNQERRKIKVAATTKVRLDDLVIFSRQLATMLDAGIPLVTALGVLSEQSENKTLNMVLLSVRRDIEGGTSLPDALAKYPVVFSEFFISMARAGEASGMLHEILDRLATYLEKTASLRRKVASGLVYPAVVVSVAILITTFLLIKVVPTFKGIFEMLGGKLPLPTQILIMVSDYLRRCFIFVFVGLIVFAFVFKRSIATPKGRYSFDKFQLKIPVIGLLLRKVAIAKFARTFSTLVKSGVPVLTALEIVGKTSGNKVIEAAVAKCHRAIRDGESISQPLSESGVFPPMVTRMIGIGEKTGQLENMLNKIAEFYEEQVDTAVSSLVSMIEPMVIVFLGVVVGGIVIALFMPIFKVSQLIAR